MSKCCEDPTEPNKIDPRELLKEKQLYGNLLRDLFTENPEKLMLRQLHSANTYIRELAALRAHYPAVRRHAIKLLDAGSKSVCERIVSQEPDSEIGLAASQRLTEFARSEQQSTLGKLIGALKS